MKLDIDADEVIVITAGLDLLFRAIDEGVIDSFPVDLAAKMALTGLPHTKTRVPLLSVLLKVLAAREEELAK